MICSYILHGSKANAGSDCGSRSSFFCFSVCWRRNRRTVLSLRILTRSLESQSNYNRISALVILFFRENLTSHASDRTNHLSLGSVTRSYLSQMRHTSNLTFCLVEAKSIVSSNYCRVSQQTQLCGNMKIWQVVFYIRSALLSCHLSMHSILHSAYVFSYTIHSYWLFCDMVRKCRTSTNRFVNRIVWNCTLHVWRFNLTFFPRLRSIGLIATN